MENRAKIARGCVEIVELLKNDYELAGRDWKKLEPNLNRARGLVSTVDRSLDDAIKMEVEMYIEFQYTGNLDSDFVDIAMEIASDSDSVESAWDAVDSLRCESKCGKCNGCVTTESIYDRGSFLENGEENGG